MKKVFAVMAILGMFAFVACGPKAEEKSEEATEQVQEAAEATTEPAAEVAATVDSSAVATPDSAGATPAPH